MPSENAGPDRGAEGATGLAYGGSTAPSRMLNNFVHDTCTGLWVASLIVLWVVGSRIAAAPADARPALTDAQHAVLWLLLAALVGLAVTGEVRLRYWRQDTPPEDAATKRAALLGKHAGFLALYGLGTALAVWLVLR